MESEVLMYIKIKCLSLCLAFSGLLVAYLCLKKMSENNGKLNWFLFYFHRFWR